MDSSKGVLDHVFKQRVQDAYEKPFQETLAEFAVLLEEYTKGSCMDHLNYYTLDFSATTHGGKREPYEQILWYTHLGLVLCVQRDWSIPIAVIGFEREPKYLCAIQLQEVEAGGSYLSPIHWEMILCGSLIVFGSKVPGVGEVRIRRPSGRLSPAECEKLAERRGCRLERYSDHPDTELFTFKFA